MKSLLTTRLPAGRPPYRGARSKSAHTPTIYSFIKDDWAGFQFSFVESLKNLEDGPVIERRTAARFPVDWQIQIERTERSQGSLVDVGMLRNISSSGALFSVSLQLATGNQIDLYIKLPLTEKRWMKYPAFVVRIEQGATHTAYAVRFASPRPEFSLPHLPA